MLKKTFIVLCCFTIITVLSSFAKTEVRQKVVRTIIIDAGHGIRPNGGADGARGSYSTEDEICHGVSKKLIAIIAKEFPEIRIVESRPTEKYVSLHDRAAIANNNKGDLFISIHVNAAPPKQHKELVGYKTEVSFVGSGKKKKKVTKQVPEYRSYTTPNPAKGTETYIWGAHKNEDKEFAMRENSPIFNEENYQEKYGDIDVNSPEFIALSLLKTKQFFKRSATLAGMVEDQFVKVGRSSRGQKQRQVGIWVLQATAMPSILVETGYITNRQEEDYLNSASGQQEIAVCLTEAIREYINWLVKQSSSISTRAPRPLISEKDATPFLEMVEQRERQRQAR